MKSNLIAALVIALSVIFLPFCCLSEKDSDKSFFEASATVENISVNKNELSFRLYRKQSDKIEIISASDYICGVLAAEVPASYEAEALKAQAVAAYGFALYRKERSTGNYDVTDDYTTDQSYIPLDKAKEKWGEKASEYIKNIKSAVAAVSGMRLTYKGKTALSVYHALSSGKTNSCKDVWGSNLPYLISVDSAFDKTSPSYVSSVTLSAEELKEKLKGLNSVSGSPSDYFKNPQKNSSGRVMKINFCGKTLTGSELQKALSLRSASFDVSCSDESFTFTVYGFGHGVGMSQNGANAMAKQGSSFKEILYHYYPHCRLEK